MKNSNVIPLIGKNNSLIEFYFNTFLLDFHKNAASNGGIVPSREFIKSLGFSSLKGTAKEIAHTIVTIQGGDIEDFRMIFFLQEKIYHYLLEYRKEYLSRFRILINDLLG